jgi:A/G-specific adenine glycosylase
MAAGSIVDELLAWYDRHGRDLPWRARGGTKPDPYRVWVSEIMLQQTTVATVKPYYRRLLALWPTINALAAADLGDVLKLWAGLGYYARARNLHKTARIVAAADGRFPTAESALRRLPGIGPYTAAAVAAIAFDRRTMPVDGNIERVVARLFDVRDRLPKAKPRLSALAKSLTPSARAGDFAQAMMDLGATVCIPRSPKCLVCPMARRCRGLAAGRAAELPRRAPKSERPLRYGVAYWMVRPDGRVMLRQRPERGLLGGMSEVPTTEFRDRPWTLAEARRSAPMSARWRPLPGVVEHGFTHFRFEIRILTARVVDWRSAAGTWHDPEDVWSQALPTAMRRVARHAVAALSGR